MKLALAIPQAGVQGTGGMAGTAGALAVGEVRGSGETPVTPLSSDPRLAFTLASHWVAGRLVGAEG